MELWEFRELMAEALEFAEVAGERSGLLQHDQLIGCRVTTFDGLTGNKSKMIVRLRDGSAFEVVVVRCKGGSR